jgi:hypothetical protein
LLEGKVIQRVKMAEVETLLAAKQKELEALEQKITQVTGRDPNERYLQTELALEPLS